MTLVSDFCPNQDKWGRQMDAYVLGTHDGDLPTHLLGRGEEGHRVLVIAPLSGPDHNVLYKIEAPDADGVQHHVERISGVGTLVGRILIRCTSENCFGLIESVKPFLILGPHSLPPYLHYVFQWLEQAHVRDEVAALVEIFGPEGVAAATDGEGHFLVEYGSDDPDKITAGDAVFSGTGHAITGEILRAD